MSTIDDLGEFLYRRLKPLLPLERLGLALLQDNGKRLTLRFLKTAYRSVSLGKNYTRSMSLGSLREVFSESAPRIIQDLGEYLKDHPRSDATRFLAAEGLRSSLACPLKVDKRRVGFLFCGARRPRAFTPSHAVVIEAAAGRIAQVLEKLHLIEQLRSSKFSHMEMLGFVSHELKRPLSNIVMDGGMLVDGYLGDVNPAQRDALQKIIYRADYLANLVQVYLNMSRFETEPLPVHYEQDVDLVERVIRPAMFLNLYTLDTHPVGTEFPERPVPCTCDPDLLRIALANLLSNAVKYAFEKGRIEISLVQTRAASTVSVYNQGPGFPPEEKTRLFARFARVQTPELLKRGGTGLGLYTCWKIVGLHGGDIRADSKPGEWARFSFTIPNRRRSATPVLRKGGK